MGVIPPIRSLRSQRKKHLQSLGKDDAPVAQSLCLWNRFVDDISFDETKWKAASPFELFSVRIERGDAPDAPPPLCLLVCKAFQHYIKTWMGTRDSGAACADVTWKINVANWGLFIFAGMATHYVADVGHRRCTALPFSMSFGPKEDLPNLYWSLKGTLAFYEKYCDIKLTWTS